MATNLNFFRGEYSNFVALETKLDSNLYFTIPDTTPNDDPKSSSYCVWMGSTLLASAKHEADLTKVIGDVETLASNLEQLTSRINNISSELADYTVSAVTGDAVTALGENVKEAYQLVKTVGETSEVVGETIKIYKDSSLKSVELSGQSLVFTYVLEKGQESVVSVDVSTFLAESEFKNGLQVVNHEVSVKADNGIEVTDKGVSAKLAENIVDEDGNVDKNFLTFEGEEGSQSLAVRSVDTNKTVLEKDLTVAGLSGSFGAGNYANGTVISAGTDVYTILENILCKEIYPTPAYGTANMTTSMSAPSLSVTANTSVQLYNSAVSFSATCGTFSVATSANTVTNINNKDTSAKVQKNVSSGYTLEQYDLKAEYTKFGKTSENSATTVTATTKNDCQINKTDLTLEMGSNTIKIIATGPKTKWSCDGIESGYTVSNLGKTNNTEETFHAVSSVTDRDVARPTNNTSKTITGVLPCYTNISGTSLLSGATQMMTLQTGTTFTDIAMPSEVTNEKHFMFDFPADRTVSTFKVKDLQGNYNAVESTYTQTEDVEHVINGVTIKYKRLQTTGAFQGDMTLQIVLSKALNSATMTGENSIIKTNE